MKKIEKDRCALHGGARAGAGRPKLEKETITKSFRIDKRIEKDFFSLAKDLIIKLESNL